MATWGRKQYVQRPCGRSPSGMFAERAGTWQLEGNGGPGERRSACFYSRQGTW